jgi:hypothetical protein
MPGYWGNALTKYRHNSLPYRGRFSNKLLKTKCLKQPEATTFSFTLALAQAVGEKELHPHRSRVMRNT